MKNFTFLITTFVFLLSGYSYAQTPIKSTFQGKYHMLSAEELSNKKFVTSFLETDPPIGKVRNIAEFEQNEAIIVTYMGWGFGIPIKLIAEIAEDVNVITIVKNGIEASEVIGIYLNNQVDTSHCDFLYAASNSYWCRDYSPWFIAVDDKVALVNFSYNRNRPDDNDIPINYAYAFNMDLYGMNLSHTGGNWMCDGMGVAASTDLVYDENPQLSGSQISEIVYNYLGVENYMVLPDPQAEYIKHIDCWAKFLDVDKILIAKLDVNDPRYQDYENMATYWASQTSAYGNKYQVFRVYSPNSQPYTNSLIVNKKVLVPIVTGYGNSYNNEALEIYRTAMPGYEVIGFIDNGYEKWEPTDALHCRTHEIPNQNMLYIYHKPLLGGTEEQSEYKISAEIIPYSKKPVSSAKLYYQINGAGYQETLMSYESGNMYSAMIANPVTKSGNKEISYYIEAQDESGQISFHPFIGQADPHVFNPGQTTDISFIENPSFDISSYPNPVKERLFVSFRSEAVRRIELIITDLNGKVYISRKISVHAGNYIEQFNLNGFSKGMYLLTVKYDGNKICTHKVIVK
ncbi:MAG: agmatine deiminase family protein [Bacteroidales bacterium]|nr:agmatine deiminase family protein [Bacteroidales bacterium]